MLSSLQLTTPWPRQPAHRRVVTLLAAAAAAAAAVALACAGAPAQASVPQLRVAANKLVDSATGSTFVPRGVNWSSFEYACYWGYGYSNQRSATSVGPDAQDAAAMASWHINTVRLPLNQDCWLGDEGLPHSDGAQLTPQGYRQAVKDWVALLHQHGLAVILDLHWGNGPDIYWQRHAEGGLTAMPDQRSAAFWGSVAATFRGDSAVMFDAFNEPYSRYDRNNRLVFDLTWQCWLHGGCRAPVEGDADATLSGQTYTTAGMQALVDAIRGAGARQPILLAGLDYANDLRGWLAQRPVDGDASTTRDDQLVASFHNYPTQRCNAVTCWDTEIAPVAAEVPVVTTEIGQSDCRDDHARSYMDWADRHDIGYLFWEWLLPDGPVACNTTSALSLIADTAGTPRAPVGTALHDHLAALAGSS